MKKDIMEWFQLRGVILDTLKSKEHIYLKVRLPRTHDTCPECLHSTDKVHDSRVRYKVHCIVGEKRVILACTIRRFDCRMCGPFTEYLPPWMNGRYKYTTLFEELVSKELIHESFSDISKKYGVCGHTLVDILKRRAHDIQIPDGDLILNIDEHSYRGRDLKIGIALANKKKFLAVLKDDNQETLRRYFKTWNDEQKSRVLEVCIDMKQSYLTVIKEVLPKANIVVDRFHVIREMHRQLDELRKILQPEGRKGARRIHRFLLLKNRKNLSPRERRTLDDVFERFRHHPTLKGAYFVKEKVCEIYECRSRKEAERKLEMLLSQLEHHEVGKLREMRDTLIRWKPYILNFFERRTTNAYIEGCHNKIKLTKRISYGFRNFGNYVLKITLALLPFLFVNLPH